MGYDSPQCGVRLYHLAGYSIPSRNRQKFLLGSTTKQEDSSPESQGN